VPRFKLTHSMAVFDDRSFQLANWSRGGAKVRDYDGHRQKGERFPIALEVSSDRGRIRLVGEATVAWREGNMLGVSWILGDSAEEMDLLLSVFLGGGEISGAK